MVGPQQPPQIYPLGQLDSDNDPRFTFGLVQDVADVVVKHGYPPVTGVDTAHLLSALFAFIYGPAGGSGRHTAGCGVWASPVCTCGGDPR